MAVASVSTTAKQWLQTVVYAPRFPSKATAVRFVVLARPRTGSTLLLELLRAHPSIYTDGELLKWRARSVPANRLIDARSVRVARLGSISGYGFKAMVGQVVALPAPSTFVSALHERGFKIIAVDRRDLLLHALSLEHAVRFDTWHNRAEPYHGFEPFAVDVDALLRTMALLDEQRTIADEMTAALPVPRVVYEDDLLPPDAHQRTADAAYQFVGVDSVPATSTLMPSAPPDVRERVTKYAQVAKRFLASTFRPFPRPPPGPPE